MTPNGNSQPVLACVHCENLREDNGKFVCVLAFDKFDFVRGIQPYLNAYVMRAPKGQCGPEGKLYIPIEAPVAAEVDAIVKAHGPTVAMRARAGASAVLGVPAACGRYVLGRYLGCKAGLGRFALRVAAAKAAFASGSASMAAPILLTADPVAEAQAIEAGAPAVVNTEAILEPATRAQADAALDQEAAAAAQPSNLDPPAAPVPLAKPSDPRTEAAAAQAAAALATVALLAWVFAGMANYMAENKPTGIFKASNLPCCHEVPRSVKCVSCRTGRVCPPLRSFKARQFYHA